MTLHIQFLVEGSPPLLHVSLVYIFQLEDNQDAIMTKNC